jgi:hypothetical protein
MPIQEDAGVIFNYFDNILSTAVPHSTGINLEALGLPSINMQELEQRFTEDEILHVIWSLPPDKAPRPNGSPPVSCKQHGTSSGQT